MEYIRPGVMSRRLLLLALAIGACNDRPTAPPFPEALVVVDTDLPAPLVASRLRVDLYAEDGRWFDSFDVARPSATDWPASFSVYSDDESRSRLVWVRLRVYPDGRVFDYRGERLRDWSDPFANPPGDGSPRLVKDAIDVTPLTEPQPLVTVDRMVLVRLRPETRGRVRVLLPGACVGTMVHFGDTPGVPSLGAVETCVDVEKRRSPVAPSPLEDDMTIPQGSAQGTWLAEPCPPASADSRAVCVPGGATILGSSENSPDVTLGSGLLDSIPVRVFGLRRFWIDRAEMSVARYRELLAEGKASIANGVTLNEGAIVGTDTPGACAFSMGRRDRESYPLNCIGWPRARETCTTRGGDLPTEAQWEHVATLAGQPSKTQFPWGDEPPTCDRAVYGRDIEPGTTVGARCGHLGLGPQPIYAADVSALGINGLAGGLSEWVMDDYVPYSAPCWREAALVDPRCTTMTKALPDYTVRGSGWASPLQRMSFRLGPSPGSPREAIGFRCAYPSDPEGK